MFHCPSFKAPVVAVSDRRPVCSRTGLLQPSLPASTSHGLNLLRRGARTTTNYITPLARTPRKHILQAPEHRPLPAYPAGHAGPSLVQTNRTNKISKSGRGATFKRALPSVPRVGRIATRPPRGDVWEMESGWSGTNVGHRSDKGGGFLDVGASNIHRSARYPNRHERALVNPLPCHT